MGLGRRLRRIGRSLSRPFKSVAKPIFNTTSLLLNGGKRMAGGEVEGYDLGDQQMNNQLQQELNALRTQYAQMKDDYDSMYGKYKDVLGKFHDVSNKFGTLEKQYNNQNAQLNTLNTMDGDRARLNAMDDQAKQNNGEASVDTMGINTEVIKNFGNKLGGHNSNPIDQDELYKQMIPPNLRG